MIDHAIGLLKFVLGAVMLFGFVEVVRDYAEPTRRALRAWHRAVRRYGLHSNEARGAYARYLNVCRGR